jgi:hypothetical protein
MAYVIGIILALAVSTYAAALRLDRDRAFYPTVLIVIALYYRRLPGVAPNASPDPQCTCCLTRTPTILLHRTQCA